MNNETHKCTTQQKSHIEGIDRYTMYLIKKKVYELVGKVGYSESDREDLEQELLLHLFENMHRFNPDKGMRSTFVDRVISNKLAHFIESRKCIKRGLGRKMSLEFLREDAEEPGELSNADYCARIGGNFCGHEERVDLRIDIERAMKALPDPLREVAERLMDLEKIDEISSHMGIHRSTVYEHIKLIRKRFEDAGIREYL